MSAADKELSRRFTQFFTTGDERLANEILSRDVVFHVGERELRGVDEVKAFVGEYRAAFPDARSTVLDQVAEDGKVVTRWRAEGTHRGALAGLPATGREFAIDGMTIERIAGGRIAEVWAVRDELRLLRQLGVLASPVTASA